VAGGIDLEYVYDGSRAIADYYADTGALRRRYVDGPGQTAPTLRALPTGGGVVRRYFHTDAVGSVVAVSNDNGSVSDTYAYGPFGETTGSGVVYRYAGQRRDHETKLQVFPARTYDPALGRFLSPDPIGYDDGPNLYAYVANDPINLADPTGLYAARLGEIASPDWNLVHTGLDVAGLVPGIGNVADVANAGLYAARGEPLLAGVSLGAAVPGLGLGVGATKLAAKLDDVADVGVSVYRSLNRAGEVNYVGITNNLSRRAGEQAKRGLNIEAIPGLSNLSRTDARAVEQVLIEQHGLAKNGGTLLNRINSIGRSNPIYYSAISRGTDLLGGAP
jgi:RHS repeat-associated protein